MQQNLIKKDESVTPNKWWEAFPKNLSATNTYYLWVAGTFTGKYDAALKRTYNQTGMSGGAMDTQTLLILANQVSSGKRKVTSIPNLLTNQLVTL
ncbi:restriction endonuclease FokI C-terminal domain-containing protein [Mammaliicoccus sp. M-M45]|uniref:restriction endonuclease FokI C-terminal domain-containing protein n=1 Tax=Mammaliicoccus sp. M-M45 TaxID=2898704 RepID=UPI001EFA79B0|nr:restriction endonuclease FokI C-terminal domain-containing protein [Mammaliicoccus sp. M-M45]